MKVYKLADDAIAKGEDVWMGIDAHKQSLHVTVVGQDEPLYRESIPYERSHLAGIIELFPDCRIEATYESGPTGYKLLYWLEELGCEAFMTPATKVKEDKGGKQVKTDSRDSLELAKQLRGGMLKEVHDHGRGHYRQRELTRTRQQLVEHRSAICNQIKSKLTMHGVEVPDEISTSWSKGFLSWLEDGPSEHRWLDRTLEELVGTYRDLSERIQSLEDELQKLASCEEDETHEEESLDDEETFQFGGWVELLETVPGIGFLSAMVLILELGDILRFETTEEFASYLGLIPGEWSSGQTRSKRAMTRWGNRRARTVLVEASWTLIQKDARMRDVYERIKAKSGSGRAICAVARRLGLAIRAMLRDRTPYKCNHPSQRREDTDQPANQPERLNDPETSTGPGPSS